MAIRHRTRNSLVTTLLTLLLLAQAPAKPTNAEILQSLKSNDPAARETTRARQRAWAAYCDIAGESLANLTARSAALFDLDPKLANHAKLISETAKTRDFLHSQHRKTPASKPELERQRVNYNQGLNQHNANPAALAAFAKQQVFACSDGFETLWRALTR